MNFKDVNKLMHLAKYTQPAHSNQFYTNKSFLLRHKLCLLKLVEVGGVTPHTHPGLNVEPLKSSAESMLRLNLKM